MIRYISTRGPGTPKSFTDVLFAGMAPDGGLYVPESWPSLDPKLLSNLQGLSYGEIAAHVMRPFIGDSLSDGEVRSLIEKTYHGQAFDHTAIAPLVQIGPQAWILELFRGPTLSFKDYAMQFLGNVFDHLLEKEGKRITIVGATSGDTGSAAIEACRHCKNIDIHILFPRGRTSAIQQKQMTTVEAKNVHAISIDGDFDDCQAIVKAMFADKTFREDVNLSAVNSINWARIMAQMVYYVAAALALGAPDRNISFAVPTGNFGNVFAAWCAQKIGLPIERLVIGTNRNDILSRFFASGAMEAETVTPSLSPSMDIQISSNFERYLFELLGRDHDKLKSLMTQFKDTKRFALDKDLHEQARATFSAVPCSDEQTLATIRGCYEATGYIIDPHTAVALHAGSTVLEKDPSAPMVMLSCAHPAKFPDTVQKAIGIEPSIPERLSAVMDRAEHYTPLPNDLEKVQSFIRHKAD